MKPIHIDGSTLEGGGQLTRTALSLSAITGTPIHLHRIRANRSDHGRSADHGSRGGRSSKDGGSGGGGLKESHLAALWWLAEHTNGDVQGDQNGSKVGVGTREVTFSPDLNLYRSPDTILDKGDGPPMTTPAQADVIALQKPGSVWLIFQAIYPFLVFGPGPPHTHPVGEEINLKLRGGTNVSKSMSTEYVLQVFLPILKKIGLPEVHVELIKRGWAGSLNEVGEVRLRIRRTPGFVLRGFQVCDRGEVERVDVSVIATSSMGQMMVEHARRKVEQVFGTDVEVRVSLCEDSGDDRKLYVLLVAHTSNGWRLGRDYLGTGKRIRTPSERARTAESAVDNALRDLVREVNGGGCVDEFMQDQLVVFQALARGESRVEGAREGTGEGSLHARTVRWVCERVLNGFGVEFGREGSCSGVGWNGKGSGERDNQLGNDDGDDNVDRMARLDIHT